MYCSMKNSLNSCSNCHEKFVVMADVACFEFEYFCFDTLADAQKCFDRIEKHNTYYGLHFIPHTAVILKPKHPYFPD